MNRVCWVIMLVIVIGCGFLSPRTHADSQVEMNTISKWNIMWGSEHDTIREIASDPNSSKWIQVADVKAIPGKPDDVSTAWMKVQLPTVLAKNQGLYIEEVFAQHIWIYIEEQLIQEIHNQFPYDLHRILIPLSSEDTSKTLYLKLETSKDRLGIHSPVQINQFSILMKNFVIHDLGNIIIGSALLFIAIVMLICSTFLKKNQLQSWISLSIIILMMGTIFITSSPFIYTYFGENGAVINDLFDISLAVFLPTLSYFFEKVFEKGKLITMFRKFQILYSTFSILFMFVNQVNAYQFAKTYYFFSVTCLGFIMIIQLSLLIGFSVLYAIRGNKDAVIFSSGFAFFALMGVIDLISYYISLQTFQMFLWKWGILGFVVALIVILGRRFAAYQDLMTNYLKELEFYNQQLQLSEKMEIISSLAASVAHEVRNPLQVTRGFLQLVAKRTTDKNKEYMDIAIEELDRASHIITDFLTFAKPQLDELTDLNISNELMQIEGIILPLATLHGGEVVLNIPQELYIRGNSSKLKQAFINIIKNSIEAFREDGQIHISAYEENNEIFIHIKDNGEGIDPSLLSKLGEPYFSTKTKGTGLGLMVTFRIIEVMKGTIEFKSQKNIGTEVIIRFPAVTQ